MKEKVKVKWSVMSVTVVLFAVMLAAICWLNPPL